MCGIVGFITAKRNGFTSKEADAFQDMLFVDTLRGWDSTGVFGRDRNGNIGAHKAAVSGARFICTKEFKEFRTQAVMKGTFMIGHNRAATRGEVSDENAHPFIVNNKIVLVQNGSWLGSHKHVKDTEVDTEAVAQIIDEEQDIEKALQRVNSSYALVWYNADTESLHIIRNNERPMHIAYTVDGGMVLASEMGTILWATERNGIDLADVPKLLQPGKLGTIKFDGSNWKEEWKEVDHKYRHQSTPFRTGTPAAPVDAGRDDNEDDPLGLWHGVDVERQLRDQFRQQFHSRDVQQARQAHPRMVPAPVPGVKQDPRKVVTKPIESHFFDLDGYHCEPKDENYLKDYCGEMSKKSHIMVELVDYLPVNDHRDCQQWYVIGHLFDHQWKDGEPSPMVYWMRQGSEADMMEYVHHSFYKVDSITNWVTRFVQNNKNIRKLMLTAYCFRAEPVNTTVTKTDEDVVNVH
jgi:hypothetical protein